jgi:hypothetical protein
MIDLSPDRAWWSQPPAVRDPAAMGASDSYASSEIIVEIIVIAEKYSPGVVLITQVRGLFLAQARWPGTSAAITWTDRGNNVVLPIHLTLTSRL